MILTPPATRLGNTVTDAKNTALGRRSQRRVDELNFGDLPEAVTLICLAMPMSS